METDKGLDIIDIMIDTVVDIMFDTIEVEMGVVGGGGRQGEFRWDQIHLVPCGHLENA